MKARRNLLGPILAAVSIFVAVCLLGGVALSATDRPQVGRPAVAFQADVSSFPTDSPDLHQRKPTVVEADDKPRPRPTLVVDIPGDLPITARPGSGRVIGTMPGGSRYYDEPLKAVVFERSGNGRFGRVSIPYSGSRTTGWIRIQGLGLSSTPYGVHADLSEHTVTVTRLGKVVMRFPAATGAAASPTPVGDYFVTDRVAIVPSNSFGSYAFGLSGIQTNLPAGWSGGDQLAIHGTQDPSSIGTSASAGCLRVTERALDRLKPLLQLGTPVTVTP
ncbi:MAG: L,D-transpeptidase [Actinomycetota bacterium]|nr:L,D-transpeptidase [Actinomycetota bacterium]